MNRWMDGWVDGYVAIMVQATPAGSMVFREPERERESAGADIRHRSSSSSPLMKQQKFVAFFVAQWLRSGLGIEE